MSKKLDTDSTPPVGEPPVLIRLPDLTELLADRAPKAARGNTRSSQRRGPARPSGQDVQPGDPTKQEPGPGERDLASPQGIRVWTGGGSRLTAGGGIAVGLFLLGLLATGYHLLSRQHSPGAPPELSHTHWQADEEPAPATRIVEVESLRAAPPRSGTETADHSHGHARRWDSLDVPAKRETAPLARKTATATHAEPASVTAAPSDPVQSNEVTAVDEELSLNAATPQRSAASPAAVDRAPSDLDHVWPFRPREEVASPANAAREHNDAARPQNAAREHYAAPPEQHVPAGRRTERGPDFQQPGTAADVERAAPSANGNGYPSTDPANYRFHPDTGGQPTPQAQSRMPSYPSTAYPPLPAESRRDIRVARPGDLEPPPYRMR